MIKLLEKTEDFQSEIEKDTVLVDFFATWCGPCKMLTPVLEAYEKNNQDIKILKIDIDSHPDLAKEFAIMSVPTLMVFKDGQQTKKESGFRNSSELDDLLR